MCRWARRWADERDELRAKRVQREVLDQIRAMTPNSGQRLLKPVQEYMDAAMAKSQEFKRPMNRLGLFGAPAAMDRYSTTTS